MQINYQAFLQFAEQHFGEVITKGDEIKVNSPFTDDSKHHLWCNPSKNAYHCWKTNKSGNLVELVCQIGKCSWKEAIGLISEDQSIRNLEDKVAKMYERKNEEIKPIGKIDLPPYTFLIDNLSKDDGFYIKAFAYLSSRKLSTKGLYVCVSGECANRVIIPYYDRTGKLIYWNGRDITDKATERYRGPDKSIGVGKEDVVYMVSWRTPKIYLTEGEFDAISLYYCGFPGCALGGKNIYDDQLNYIRDYEMCLCFDTDKSGADALNNIGNYLIRQGMRPISYVRPPAQHKDWNKMLIHEGQRLVMHYVRENEKPFTDSTSVKLRSGS